MFTKFNFAALISMFVLGSFASESTTLGRYKIEGNASAVQSSAGQTQVGRFAANSSGLQNGSTASQVAGRYSVRTVEVMPVYAVAQPMVTTRAAAQDVKATPKAATCCAMGANQAAAKDCCKSAGGCKECAICKECPTCKAGACMTASVKCPHCAVQ